MQIRHLIAVSTALALAPLVAPTFAQSYPAKAIKFVVPFPAGSATDVVGRVLAEAMGKGARPADRGRQQVRCGAPSAPTR